jgi:hypothetical protein
MFDTVLVWKCISHCMSMYVHAVFAGSWTRTADIFSCEVLLLSGVKLQILDCECICECHYCWFDKCCISLGCLNIYRTITNATDITETGRKGKHVHSLDKCNIYLANKNNLHMNYMHTHIHNPIYETLQQTATPKSQTTYNFIWQNIHNPHPSNNGYYM